MGVIDPMLAKEAEEEVRSASLLYLRYVMSYVIRDVNYTSFTALLN